MGNVMASTNRPGSQISNKGRTPSKLDKYLFFIVFLSGSCGIIAFKVSGFSQVFVTAWPIGLMLLYFFFTLVTKQYLLREDIVGDNLYYLGFLYTLTSLAYSLHIFSQDEGGAREIVSNFGIALATTIFGLALRVLLNQMREDPVEIERKARVDLAEAVSRLKSELNAAVLELKGFCQGVSRTLTETGDHAEKKYRTIFKVLIRLFKS